MKKVLLLTNDSVKESTFIKEYLYGINYSKTIKIDKTIYKTDDTTITIVKPYSHLVGHRYHEIYIDSNISNEEYINMVKSTLIQSKSSIFNTI